MMQPPSWLPHTVRDPLEKALGQVRRQSYAPVPQKTEVDRSLDVRPHWSKSAQQMARRRPFVVLVGLVIAVLLFFPKIRRGHATGSVKQVPVDTTVTGKADIGHVLYTFIPVNTSNPDPELCKTILSTEILGYPPPMLMFHDNDLGDYLRQVNIYMGKVNRGLKIGNSFAIVLDSPSAWFQLRPEVLLDRYYRLLVDENARLHGNTSPSRQKVVFGATNICRTTNKEECAFAPMASPDAVSPDYRYIDTALAMGPIEDMAPIFTRAVGVAGSSRLDSLQAYQEIFGGIFLEQERQRGQSEEITQLGRRGANPDGRPDDQPLESNGAGLMATEWGIALDYQGQLGQSPTNGPNHLEWVQHGVESWALKQIATTMPPFWTITGLGVPLTQNWHDIKLLTNVKTNTVPAVVSFNYDKTAEAPTYHKSWWSNMWFQPYARRLYDHVALRPAQALATVVDPAGLRHTYWRRHVVMEKAGAHNSTNKDHFVLYRTMCSGEAITNEVFADDEGDWVNPAP